MVQKILWRVVDCFLWAKPLLAMPAFLRRVCLSTGTWWRPWAPTPPSPSPRGRPSAARSQPSPAAPCARTTAATAHDCACCPRSKTFRTPLSSTSSHATPKPRTPPSCNLTPTASVRNHRMGKDRGTPHRVGRRRGRGPALLRRALVGPLPGRGRLHRQHPRPARHGPLRSRGAERACFSKRSAGAGPPPPIVNQSNPLSVRSFSARAEPKSCPIFCVHIPSS